MERQRMAFGQLTEIETTAYILGRIVERTGRRPSEAVISLLKQDSKLLDAFFVGAIEGDRQRRGPAKK